MEAVLQTTKDGFHETGISESRSRKSAAHNAAR